MAEYFGYVDHAVDSQVNWAEINKSVVGMIHDEQARRETKKVALDQMTNQLQEELAKTPTGINQDANKFASNYTSDSTAQSLMNAKLLKAGVMKPKDFILRTQNLSRDTNTTFDLAKAYQDFAKTTQEGIDKGEFIANVDIYKGIELEKYANLGNTRAVFNATDGSVALGVFDPKTGKYTNVRSVSVLKSMLGTNTKAYDVDKSAKTFADRTGKVSISAIIQKATTSRAGISLDISNPELFSDAALKDDDELKKVKDNYIAAESGAIKAIMNAPNGDLTVVMSKLGKYDSSSLTQDKQEADSDPSKVLIKVGLNGNISLDETGAHYEDQKKEAEDWIRLQIRNQIDAEIKKTTDLNPLKAGRTSATPTAGTKKPVPPLNYMTPLWQIAMSDDPSVVEKGITSLKGFAQLPNGATIVSVIPRGNHVFDFHYTDKNFDKIGVDFSKMTNTEILGWGGVADPNMGEDKKEAGQDYFIKNPQVLFSVGSKKTSAGKTPPGAGAGTAAGQSTLINTITNYNLTPDKFIENNKNNKLFKEYDITIEKTTPSGMYQTAKSALGLGPNTVKLKRIQSDGTKLSSEDIVINTNDATKIKENHKRIQSFEAEFK